MIFAEIERIADSVEHEHCTENRMMCAACESVWFIGNTVPGSSHHEFHLNAQYKSRKIIILLIDDYKGLIFFTREGYNLPVKYGP